MTLLILLAGSDGGSPVVIDYSITIALLIPPDDLALTVPEEQTVYTDWYDTLNLVDEAGNQLVDEAGNLLIASTVTTENVYVLIVPPDDLSIVVPEET